MNFSAVILAGGKSTRMGRNKALLEDGGQTLLARQIQLVRNIGAAEVLISSGNGDDYPGFGCPVLRDKYENIGPLAGIERALDVAHSPLLLVLAVDMPRMDEKSLHWLLAGCAENCGAIGQVDGRVEPLAAFYPKVAHTLILALMSKGFRSATSFAEGCVKNDLATFITITRHNHSSFANWNIPADISSAQ